MKNSTLILVVLLTIGLTFGITSTPEYSFAKDSKTATSKNKTDKKSAPAKTQAKKSSKKQPAPQSISINKANKEQLMSVPGIGPKTADAIITYRKASPFESIDDLTKVKGIGEKSLAKMKRYLKK